mgnify:CR=1 FL=1
MSKDGISCHRSALHTAPPDRTSLPVMGAMYGSLGFLQVRTRRPEAVLVLATA